MLEQTKHQSRASHAKIQRKKKSNQLVKDKKARPQKFARQRLSWKNDQAPLNSLVTPCSITCRLPVLNPAVHLSSILHIAVLLSNILRPPGQHSAVLLFNILPSSCPALCRRLVPFYVVLLFIILPVLLYNSLPSCCPTFCHFAGRIFCHSLVQYSVVDLSQFSGSLLLLTDEVLTYVHDQRWQISLKGECNN